MPGHCYHSRTLERGGKCYRCPISHSCSSILVLGQTLESGSLNLMGRFPGSWRKVGTNRKAYRLIPPPPNRPGLSSWLPVQTPQWVSLWCLIQGRADPRPYCRASMQAGFCLALSFALPGPCTHSSAMCCVLPSHRSVGPHCIYLHLCVVKLHLPFEVHFKWTPFLPTTTLTFLVALDTDWLLFSFHNRIIHSQGPGSLYFLLDVSHSPVLDL